MQRIFPGFAPDSRQQLERKEASAQSRAEKRADRRRIDGLCGCGRGCVLLRAPSLGKLPLDALHEDIIEVVEDHEHGRDDAADSGKEAHHQADALERARALDNVCLVAKVREEPSTQGPTHRPADFCAKDAAENTRPVARRPVFHSE